MIAHIFNLIVSLVAAAVLLTVGIYSVLKKEQCMSNDNPPKIVSNTVMKVSEWVMISLGVLLLAFSIWSFVECGNSSGGSYGGF